MLDVSLLGTGGMMPLPNRFLTALLTRLDGRMFLIDCGEGTQVTMKLLGWGYKNLDAICFTHYHADHISGLPGLLLAIENSGRTEPLTLIGPPGLMHIVRSLRVIAPEISFPLNFIELKDKNINDIQIPNTQYIIHALAVEHSAPCYAYSIEVKRLGKFNAEAAAKLDLPKKYWSVLQAGETVLYDGREYTPGLVMGSGRKGIKVSYCTDARPDKSIAAFIEGADLFVCEGLYGDNEKSKKAAEHKHMVYAEAAQLAYSGGVGKMWLTHFSPAMNAPNEHLNNARDIFKNSFAGYDRLTETIHFID